MMRGLSKRRCASSQGVGGGDDITAGGLRTATGLWRGSTFGEADNGFDRVAKEKSNISDA
jgi:hypothetical protein